jgi:hypothetical protein
METWNLTSSRSFDFPDDFHGVECRETVAPRFWSAVEWKRNVLRHVLGAFSRLRRSPFLC